MEKDWGKIAKNFDEFSEYVVGRDINNMISEKLSKENKLGKVIELGCGTGYFTKIIVENAENIIATDISEDMLDVARRQLADYKKISFQKIDCKATGFPEKKFDTVLMVNLLHVLKKTNKILEECYRILKPGGVLIIIDLTSYGMKKLEILKLMFRYLRKMGKPPKADKGNLSPGYLEAHVKNAGFKVEDNILLGNKTKALYLRGMKNG